MGTGAAETVRCVSERLGKALAGAEMATLSAGIFRERGICCYVEPEFMCWTRRMMRRLFFLGRSEDPVFGGSSAFRPTGRCSCLVQEVPMRTLTVCCAIGRKGPDFLPSDENGGNSVRRRCAFSFRTGWMPMGEEGNPKFIRRLEWLLSCESPANITGWLSDGRQISRFRSQLKGEALEKWEWYPALSGGPEGLCISRKR